MLKLPIFSLGIVSIITLGACNNKDKVHPNIVPINDKVMTLKDQQNMSPDSVIQVLKTGNEHFYSNKLTSKNDSLRIHLTASSQYPMAAVLACSDSRIPVEEVFDKGIGDLFVIRVAGNITDDDISGSLEYACKVSGVKVIVVLGHEHCGAVKAAIDNVKDGNITALVDKIKPAVDAVNINGDKTSKNDLLVHAVAIKNIELTIKKIIDSSKLIKNMAQKGSIKFLGGIYDLDSGKITFINS